MASPAQIAANRRNARLSTGPMSKMGKEKSCRNALKHGLTATALFLPGEEEKEFSELHSRLRAEMMPATLVEDVLTERAAELIWRLRRVNAFETALFEHTINIQKEIDGDDNENCVQPRISVSQESIGRNNKLAKQRLLAQSLVSLLDRSITCKLSRYEAHLTRQLQGALNSLEFKRRRHAE